MIDLGEEDEGKITSATIKGKEEKIIEIETNLEREKYVIKFLEQENQQLKTKQVINEVKCIKAQREVEKAQALLEETLERFGEPDDEEDQPPRQRPKTRGLKRALALEKQREADLAAQLTPIEKLSLEINKDREPWLQRSNLHLDKLLEKANKDNDLLRTRVKLHARKERIALAKIKRENAKIENLTKQGEKEKLDILSQVSLHASKT